MPVVGPELVPIQLLVAVISYVIGRDAELVSTTFAHHQPPAKPIRSEIQARTLISQRPLQVRLRRVSPRNAKRVRPEH